MKNPFAREVYIRLAEGGKAYVSTVKYGRFYSRTTEVPLHQPVADDDKAHALVKKRLLGLVAPDDE